MIQQYLNQEEQTHYEPADLEEEYQKMENENNLESPDVSRGNA